MITIVGIGPGDDALRLVGADAYFEAANKVVGFPRQLESCHIPTEKQWVAPRFAELKAALLADLDANVVILASGDPLLYGIGNWAVRELPADRLRIIPGISSVQYCFHQLKLSMNDVYLTSSHGRQPDFDFLLQHEKIGMVTDATIGPKEIAAAIRDHHQHRNIFVGENLSYPNEKISEFSEITVPDREFGMNVVVITNA